MSGIKIGNGAVIIAGSVVTKSVPDYAILASNPAKVIKYKFREAETAQLLEIRW